MNRTTSHITPSINMKLSPLVSFVIASNRVDEYLKQALDSVFAQTYANLEVIFISNGDNYQEVHDFVTRNYSFNNLIAIKTRIPQLSFALNLGIDHSNGEYIARMDTDDICYPDRIEKQISYILEKNIDILGSSVELIDENSKTIKIIRTKNNKHIEKTIYFKSPLYHPSVIYKKSSILKIRGYNAGFNSEDYDLWLRAYRNGLKIDNISDVLLKYRVHSQSSQGRGLGYAEVAGYSMREFLLTKNIYALISIPINFLKYFFLKK